MGIDYGLLRGKTNLLGGACIDENLNQLLPTIIYCYAERRLARVPLALCVNVSASINEYLSYFLMRVINCAAEDTSWVSISVSACIDENLNQLLPTIIYCYAERRLARVPLALCVNVSASINEYLSYFLMRVINCAAEDTSWVSISVSACIDENLNQLLPTIIYCYAERRLARVPLALCVNVSASINEYLSYFLMRVINCAAESLVQSVARIRGVSKSRAVRGCSRWNVRHRGLGRRCLNGCSRGLRHLGGSGLWRGCRFGRLSR